jgi:hypothetical protein
VSLFGKILEINKLKKILFFQEKLSLIPILSTIFKVQSRLREAEKRKIIITSNFQRKAEKLNLDFEIQQTLNERTLESQIQEHG